MYKSNNQVYNPRTQYTHTQFQHQSLQSIQYITCHKHLSQQPISALITTDVQHHKAKSMKCHTALADSSICFSRSISCRNWRISDTFASCKRKMCNKTTDWLCICSGYGHKTKERSYCSTNQFTLGCTFLSTTQGHFWVNNHCHNTLKTLIICKK